MMVEEEEGRSNDGRLCAVADYIANKSAGIRSTAVHGRMTPRGTGSDIKPLPLISVPDHR